MSVSVNDLQPKSFKIKVNDVELTSKPIKLKHALILAKVGNVFENASSASNKDIESASDSIEEVLAELIPELKDIDLDMTITMEIMTKLLEHINPDDNQELIENKVSMNTDPKV